MGQVVQRDALTVTWQAQCGDRLQAGSLEVEVRFGLDRIGLDCRTGEHERKNSLVVVDPADQMRGEGVLPVKDIVGDTIARPRASREILIRTMQVRVAELVSGLTDRLPGNPDLTELFAALDRVDDETLAVLVESRGSETRESGGPEIDV